jgi:predicted DsbA family dithiol-disulfide isomerase
MKVEIWSDIACPFCYLGKKRFEEALAQFAGKDNVEIVYRSFELDPNAPVDTELDTYGMLAKKYGMSREQARANTEQIVRQGLAHGIAYNFDKSVLTNTFDAHRLTHLAGRSGKMGDMLDRLYQAYFTDGEHVGKRETLVRLAEEVGLDPQETASALDGGDFADEVRQDEREAASLGIRAVPFFVINRKYGISGAQPTDVFLRTLEKVWSEERPLTVVGDDGAACGDDGCALPGDR